jgi:iron complex outermembrane receptor protein
VIPGRRSAVSVAVAATLSGVMILPTSLQAQDIDEEGRSVDGQVIEEVITYGQYRASLVDALGTKRDSTTIVDALSAEDIGKLPDSSIAESLARMPGLAGARVNGRTSGISVRGFKEDYVTTTLNGRELLGIGDNRGVEYDLYPSQIISGIVVYKAADASLWSPGIGGTVDLRTTRPLDSSPVLAFTGTLEQNDLESGNPDFDDGGHRLAFNFSDTYMDDRVGVALALATTESPSQEQHFRGWGYPTVDPANAGTGVSLTGDETILGGHDSFVRSAMLERDTVAAVVQFEPVEDLTLTFDALYIDFQEDKVFRGVEEGGAAWGTGNYTVTGVDNGFVTGGNLDGGFQSVIRNDGEFKTGELTTGGINIEWRVGDDWTLGLDASYGDVRKTITNIESYSGLGRAGSATQGDPTVRAWTMTPTGAVYSDVAGTPANDLGDFNLVRLAGPQSWGGSLQPVSEFQDTGIPGIGPQQAQDGFVNEPDFDEQLTTVRLDAERPLDWSVFTNVEFGLFYSDREKTKNNRGFYLTAPTFPNDGPIPEEYRLGTADLSFIGISDVVAYDGIRLYRDGYYTATDAQQLETGRLGDTYVITEEVMTLYGKVDFETDVGNLYLTGNFGLQLIDSDQEGFGFDSFTGADQFVNAVPTSGGDSYTDVLPSLNLNLELAENHLLRFAASKTMTRPRMDDMRPNNVVNFNFNAAQVGETSDIANSPWSGGAGNPTLKPLESNNYDLSYEWYFSDDGFLSVATFYKELTNWHRDGGFIADFSQFYIPGYHQAIDPDTGDVIAPTLFQGNVGFKQDGLEGFVRGQEIQALLPFGMIAEPLEGLGFVGSAAFNDGQLDDGAAVPGLSKEIYSLTLFYERGGFAARVAATKRSKFLTEARGLSLSLQQTVDQGAELIDAQVSFDFGMAGIERLDGLFIALQGQNLTDEDTILANTDSREVTQFQTFGANYLLTAIYRFE